MQIKRQTNVRQLEEMGMDRIYASSVALSSVICLQLYYWTSPNAKQATKASRLCDTSTYVSEHNGCASVYCCCCVSVACCRTTVCASCSSRHLTTAIQSQIPLSRAFSIQTTNASEPESHLVTNIRPFQLRAPHGLLCIKLAMHFHPRSVQTIQATFSQRPSLCLGASTVGISIIIPTCGSERIKSACTEMQFILIMSTNSTRKASQLVFRATFAEL